jgi:hypothetical protein
MIVGFTVALKRGKGESCKTKTFGFTLMLTRGKMLSSTTRTEREQDNTTQVVTSQSEYSMIETAKEVQFFKLQTENQLDSEQNPSKEM